MSVPEKIYVGAHAN